MDTYTNSARHQIERGGRLFAPGQVVPGVNPKNEEDAVLIEHGLVTKVEKTEKPAAKQATKKDDTGSAGTGSSEGKEKAE